MLGGRPIPAWPRAPVMGREAHRAAPDPCPPHALGAARSCPFSGCLGPLQLTFEGRLDASPMHRPFQAGSPSPRKSGVGVGIQWEVS